MTLDLTSDQDVLFADFGEAGGVTTASGETRDGILLLMYRQQPSVQSEGAARVRSYHIGIKNSAAAGLTPDEALQQADGTVASVSFPESHGDSSNITRPINRILKQNGGMLLVEVLLT